ncbi:MAG: hypothetical protein V4629_02260 [Pseudomonadota bacterium]
MAISQKGSVLAAGKSLKLLVLVLFLMATFVRIAAAENLGEQAESSLDALKKANQYSFENNGVGIVMSYGTKNGVSAEEIGNAFVQEILRRGHQARYFYYQTDRDGVAIEFHMGYSALGPWNPDFAASQMGKIIERTEAMQKIHGE